jgi:hypothetical protein
LKGVTRGVVGTTAQTGATDDKVYFANWYSINNSKQRVIGAYNGIISCWQF